MPSACRLGSLWLTERSCVILEEVQKVIHKLEQIDKRLNLKYNVLLGAITLLTMLAYYAHFNLQVFGVKHAKDTSKNQFQEKKANSRSKDLDDVEQLERIARSHNKNSKF